MSKLHRLRKAILRDPQKWFAHRGWINDRRHIAGAVFRDGQWKPTGRSYAYSSFVRVVLRAAGITEVDENFWVHVQKNRDWYASLVERHPELAPEVAQSD